MNEKVLAVQSSKGANGKGERQKMVFLLVLAAVGALLLILGSNLSGADKDDSGVSDEIKQYDEAEYEKALTEKIEKLCASVKGAGKIRVAVSLDGSYKAIYAQNATSSDKSEYLLVGNGSNEQALLLGYSPPKLLGVGVVCEGASNKGVRAEIISLLSAFLDLPTNKIYVATLKN